MTTSMLVVPFLLAGPCVSAQSLSGEASEWREYARVSLQGGLAEPLGLSVAETETPVADSQPRMLRGAVDRLALSVQASFATTPMLQGMPVARSSFQMESPLAAFVVESSRFSSSMFSPQLQARVGAASELRFGLTVASQRYATPGFGELHASTQWLPQMGLRSSLGVGAIEQSYGQGVHFGFDSTLGEHFLLGVSAQSRVDMDAFKTYRGLFSEPGDFDVPARTGVSFGVQPMPGLSMSLGAERVYYSDVAAFTTFALPTQLLALLGDGSAPTFAWRDLNVYTAKAELADASGGQWGLQVTTRQQPSPTSALFELALRDLHSGNHYSASYQRQVGSASSFSVGASYAPAQYILGPNPFRNRYREGSQVEVELNWSVAF